MRAPRSPSWSTDLTSDGIPDAPHVRASLPDAGEGAAKRVARRFWDNDLDSYGRSARRPRRGCDVEVVAAREMGLHPSSTAVVQARRVSCTSTLPHRAVLARVLRRCAARGTGLEPSSMEPRHARPARRRWPVRRRSLRRVDSWAHWLPARRRGDAAAADRRLDAQPGAHGGRELPREGPAHRLDAWRPALPTPPRRRRPRVEQPRLAVGRGTGTDASPFNRIFNPVAQSLRFDADGTYIRRYVPELAGVDAPAIHEPWNNRRRPTERVPGADRRPRHRATRVPSPLRRPSLAPNHELEAIAPRKPGAIASRMKKRSGRPSGSGPVPRSHACSGDGATRNRAAANDRR